MRTHWPEYLMEAANLGIFMVSACAFTALLEFPASPARLAIADPAIRRTLMGLCMGGTAVAIIYSPWGQQSGAHINPAVTLTFFRLGKVRGRDVVGYVAAQFAGAAVGVALAGVALAPWLAHPAVNYAATAPGPAGLAVAFVAEAVISCVLMLTVLTCSNSVRLSRFTGLFAGLLVASYIAIESPLSGMSMNPARTVGSALFARLWTAIWLYFAAPILGMLLGAEVYLRWSGGAQVLCAKLNHHTTRRCIFRCRYQVPAEPPP